MWLEIRNRHKNSVVQIMAVNGKFNIPEPYFPVREVESRGSGFFIDIEGYILTNAHVVTAPLSFTFRTEATGNEILYADLIAICHAKDVALLKARPESIVKIGKIVPFMFADDHQCKQTQRVIALGYPLGKERLTIASGDITGYDAPDPEEHSGSQSYIQTNIPVNPGSSGCPMVNAEGKVVGIISAGIPSAQAQNTNYAIPTRVVLSILRELFSREGTNKPLVLPPRLGMIFQRITLQHFESIGVIDEEDQIGLRITELNNHCPYDVGEHGVTVGDVLQVIKYADPYHEPKTFEVDTYKSGVCYRCNDNPDTFIMITRFGDVKVYGIDDEEKEFTRDRKVALSDVLDTIPFGTTLTLDLLDTRPDVKEKVFTVKGPFICRNDSGIRKLYPPFDELDYVIFGGCVWIPLSSNVMEVAGTTKNLCRFLPHHERETQHIMLSKIFSDNDTNNTEALEVTEILTYVNDSEVQTLDELRERLIEIVKSETYISLVTNMDKEIVLNVKKALEQDKAIHKKFSIRPSDFSEELWSYL